MARMKRRVHEILEVAAPGDRASRLFDLILMLLIILNVVAVILETVEEIFSTYDPLFRAFDTFSVAVFSIEYLLRVWSSTSDERYAAPVWGRLRFMRTPLAIIDLVAILPFYLPLLFVDLRFVRAIRLFRLFRLFKMARYSESMRTLGRVLALKKEELLITLFTLLILLVFSSSMVYHVEHEAQPEIFSSIPAAMWWGVVTLTTVGYGDVYPITPGGKFIGALVILVGIGMFALPAGILASGFVEEVHHRREKEEGSIEVEVTVVCPHCGRRIYEPVYIEAEEPGGTEES
jgi:voltage-gated potassium channel